MIVEQTQIHLDLKSELIDLTIMPKVQEELIKFHEEKVKQHNELLVEHVRQLMEKFGILDVQSESVRAAKESMMLSTSNFAIPKLEQPDFGNLVSKNKLLRQESVGLIDRLETFIQTRVQV